MQSQKKVDRFPPSEISWAAIEFERLPHPLWAQAFLILLTGMILIGIAFSVVAKVPLVIQGRGILTSLTPPVPIRSATKMTVAKVHVVENQRVRKGQPLVASVESITSSDLALLKTYRKELLGLLSSDIVTCGDRCLRRLKAQASAYLNLRLKGEAVTIVEPVQDQVREIVLALEERKILPQLTADLSAQISVISRKISEIKNQRAEAALAKEFDALKVDLAANRTRVKEKFQRSDERIAAARGHLNARLTDLGNRLDYLGTQYAVVAPFDGIVTSMNVKGSGEVLHEGQDLMTLVPVGTPLIAELELDNKDVADVRPNMDVEVVIDPLPEYEYGTVHGKVIEVARKDRDSLYDRKLANLTTSVFVVRVHLDKQSLKRSGQETQFALGMTTKGRVAVRHESVFHVVVRSLFRMKDDFEVKNRL